MLVQYFINRYAYELGKKVASVDQNTIEILKAYSWPGNIRELQNVIERSLILSEPQSFSVDQKWLSQQSPPAQSASELLSDSLVAREKELIEAALAQTRGRVSGPRGAAAKLGIPASTLESKIRALKIGKHRFKTA